MRALNLNAQADQYGTKLPKTIPRPFLGILCHCIWLLRPSGKGTMRKQLLAAMAPMAPQSSACQASAEASLRCWNEHESREILMLGRHYGSGASAL